MQKNRFAAAGFDDSDDEVVQQKTKTQVKKEERKITEKKAPKVNAQAMEDGGFNVVSKDQAKPAEPKRGGRGAQRGDHVARGGRGQRPIRTDADGNKVGAGNNNQRERRPYTGKPREDAHPMDRRSGTGRGRRPENKKEGHGKGNVGQRDDVAYKKKTDDAGEEEQVEEKKEEAPKVEEPKVIIKEEVIGISIEDFFANRQRIGKKEGREAEGVKDAKVQAKGDEKVKQATLLQNQYQKGSVATTSDA